MAGRTALDAMAASWIIGSEADGSTPHLASVRLSRLDLDVQRHVAWRAAGGPSKAEPAADAGPAAPQAPP
jgi:hypothetical protein